MQKWDYDVRTLSDVDRLPILKKMGEEGWEVVGFKDDPKPTLSVSSSPYNNYCTYLFKRPIDARGATYFKHEEEAATHRADLEREQAAESYRRYLHKFGPVMPKEDSKPNFVMVDDPVLYLIVRMEDQNRILSIMSRAGYYIKDVTTDRKVDGAYVTYTFTQRKKT